MGGLGCETMPRQGVMTNPEPSPIADRGAQAHIHPMPVRSPKDLAERMSTRPRRTDADGFRRVTFALPREAARERAKDFFRRYPKAAYLTEVESWRELSDGRIEFTMRRLPSAD